MTAVRPDVVADLTTLAYAPESVHEIRLHHVFEHFWRSTALRLLIDWYRWLDNGGTLVIETPDFERCVREFLREDGVIRKALLVRHLYGSHEAGWAVHCDGWYGEKFEHVLGGLGYRDLELTYSGQEYFNVTVSARKRRPFAERADQLAFARSLLQESLVGDGSREQRLLAVWLDELAPGASSSDPPAHA